MNLADINKGLKTKQRKPKRVGRGSGSGSGKTSGRGQKGQRCRTGIGRSPLFEGGTMPYYRRIPKRGFSHARFSKEIHTLVNIEDLNIFKDGQKLTPADLVENGIIKKNKRKIPFVKILGKGELTVPSLSVEANGFSEKAREKILASGGQVKIIS